MKDIETCSRCGSNMITEMEEKLCGITIRCRIKCHSCKHVIEKPTKRAAYKTWEKECKENDR